jgi:hypothetical protein
VRSGWYCQLSDFLIKFMPGPRAWPKGLIILGFYSVCVMVKLLQF